MRGATAVVEPEDDTRRWVSRPGARLPWPLVPRREEDRAVTVLADDGWSVAIVGAAGLGKSVVAARVTDRVAQRSTGDVRVIPITASPHETAKPFAAAIARFGDLPAAALTDELEAEHTLRVAADLVDRDVVLRIDDADHLDPITARYVAWLVRHAHARLVLTCRDFTRLEEPLRRLWQDDLLERIDLTPLDLRETERLLERALSGPLEHASVERVHRATRGNPLHLREVVRAAVASGALERTASGWYWPGRITASNSLADMYRSELAGLEPALRDVVDIVALADPIPLSRLLALVDDADVDRVASLGIVSVDSDMTADGTPVVRPAHPLVGEVVRSLVPVARRARLFARANAFRADPVGGDAPPAARLRAALWALECGVVPSADQLLDAAGVAVRLQEYESATALASSALSADDTTLAVSVAALCLRATARTYGVGREAARHDAERAWLLARSDPTALPGDLLVEAVEVLANLRQFHDDDVDAAVALVEEAATLVDDASRERLRVLRLTHLGWGGRFAEVLAEVERSGVLHAPVIPFGFLAIAPCAVVALATTGRIGEALRLCRTSLEVAAANIEVAPWSLGELYSVLHQVQLWAGDVSGLTVQVDRRWSPFFKYDFTLELLGAGNQALAERRWDDAITAFSGACERFAVLDHGGFAGYAWAKLAFAQAVAGRTREAVVSAERARATPLRGMRITGEEIPLSLTFTDSVLGRPAAMADAMTIAQRSERSGAWMPAMLARNVQFVLLFAQGADTRGALARLRAAAEHVEGALAPAIVGHAAALASGDERVIAEARATLAAAGVMIRVGQKGPPLTRREYEVAELAGQGLSNRQIAEQLGRSVRTIDAHIARIFAKWDIHSRSELVDRL
ncbi:LuxR C-terminal-related transcriptional regulator [Curtobacterium sp. MCBD17_035]|uniref:helix-turn-helix transcriptional regulator n=1 Tax=Curtobacterium sp. MCBD17_035 TaxID=2175673 RepID=UPI000DA7735E|nr:LuxR C-terminal-related transcriptional regulator [Curtobacterium sp. MCBD17_035]WIB68019.1 LuxR C-terminal-related transcriptional regulator [Curtobacterium sp. MCBD17_035]